MPVWFLFIIFCLAVFRVTRFFVADALGDEFKDWFFDRLVRSAPSDADGEMKPWFGKLLDELQYLLSCYWCLSVWVSAWFTGVSAWFVDVPAPFLWWLAVSGVVGLLSLVDREWFVAER